MANSKKILRCYHCGNLVTNDLVFSNSCELLFDEIENEEKIIEKFYHKFDFLNYKCSTCGGINLLGGFDYSYNEYLSTEYQRLYPKGPDIVPPDHHWVEGKSPVPEKLVKIYEEIWYLKHQVPNAFGNQIRRCLEFICNEKEAEGKTLYAKLINLSKKGLLPGTYKDISNIIRIVGNIGSHSTDYELDYWDVELLDEFFKIIVDYIYVIPAKLKRLETRINVK